LEQLPPETQEAKETKRVRYDYPTLEFDVDEFWHFVESFDLTDAEKRDYLETIWSIIVSFVDLGFGIHPIQQACGKLTDNFAESAQEAPDSLYLPHIKDSDKSPEKGGAP